MPIDTANPISVEQISANEFEIAHIDTTNNAGVFSLAVWWNAFTKAEDGSRTLVKNCGPYVIEGDRLLACGADFLARANAFVAAGAPAGLASQGGYRDAVYAELQHAGMLPASS